jgi:ABC-type transport system involved in multi-copper enzyme maturation permease subunit
LVEQSLAIARYTIIELSRRRLLLIIVVLGLLLTAGLGVAPLLIPGAPTGEDRILFLLNALSGTVAVAIEICTFAVGMTVINHDLDSGAAVAIFAKPLSRFAYAAGKLAAAASLLLILVAVFAAGTLLVITINGGGHTGVLLWFFAATAANVVVLMVLLMALTVYLNNIVAAVIGFVFNFLMGLVLQLHALAQNGVIASPTGRSVINVAYWLFPHALASNLSREIVTIAVRRHPAPGGFDPLSGIPPASGAGDIAFWFGYLVLLCGVLWLALRRKQL